MLLFLNYRETDAAESCLYTDYSLYGNLDTSQEQPKPFLWSYFYMVKFLKLYLIFDLYLSKMSKLFSTDEHCTKLKDKNFPVADVNVFQGF